MIQVLLVIHILIALALIGLVLIQHGKGADVGATFGSGASGTIFGSQGSANFLSRTTAYLAVAFFVINLTLAYLGNKEAFHRRALDITAPIGAPAAPANSAPATTAPAGTTGEASAPAAPATAPATAPAALPETNIPVSE